MRCLAALIVTLATATQAYAWDPIGDITHPDRIIRNVGREVGNAGRQIDQARIEAQVQAAAPGFQQWLIQSRNNAAAGARYRIPPEVREELEGFYDEDILNRVSFKIGDAGVFNLANLSITYGGARAVTLVDVIVFKSEQDAYNDLSLWAHELKHVQQFRDWGTRDFAIRYLRSWNSVEGEAYAAEKQYANWRSAGAAALSYQPAAQVCATPWGYCPMGVQIPVGSPCLCPSYQGPLQGIGR